jgi:hypothetical protein
MRVVVGFDWSDAGVCIGIGGAGAVAVRTALAMRRRRITPQDVACPSAR